MEKTDFNLKNISNEESEIAIKFEINVYRKLQMMQNNYEIVYT